MWRHPHGFPGELCYMSASKNKTNPYNLAKSPTQLKSHFFFLLLIVGKEIASECYPLSWNTTFSQRKKKKKHNTTFPCFPVVLIRHTAQYARDKDPDQTPRTRDPSTRQNLASSVVVKALYLQNKWVRKGFSTECKEWCCIEGYTEVKHIYVTCEWTWRQLTGAETAAMQWVLQVGIWKKFSTT